jgi:parallel beta-helix repeat protein
MSLYSRIAPVRTKALSGVLNNTASTLTFSVRGSDGFQFGVGQYIVAWNEDTYPNPLNDPNARVGLITNRSSTTLTVSWNRFGTSTTALAGTPSIAPLFDGSGEGLQQALDDVATAYPKGYTSGATIGPVGSSAAYVVSATAAETQINNAMDAVAATGGGIVQQRAGTYTQGSSHILPKSNIIYSGEGKATNIVLAATKVVKVDQQSNVTIKDIAIDASANSSSNSYAIYIDRSSDVTVNDVLINWTYAYGIFVTNQTAGTTVSRFRFTNNRIIGACHNDLIGGGPGVDTAHVSEIFIHNNFIKQDATLSGAGTYLNAIDIVAQEKCIISNNITYGGMLLGGEKIPHSNVDIIGNIVNAPYGIASGIAVGQIGILCASNTTPQQTGDSYGVNIIGNQITSGNIFVQGQSATSNRTRKVNISNNYIVNNPSASYADHTYGINLNYVANVKVHNNIVQDAVRGIYLNDTDSVDVSNNDFSNCTTPIVLNGTNTNLTGHNNKGINPDITANSRNITGSTTFTRVDGLIQPFTFTGSVSSTMTNGFFVGDRITRIFTMGGSGGYTYTKGSNEKLAGGGYTPTASVGSKDILTQEWDGTNWVEVSRALNIS